jgi:hypothetical protein
MLTNQEFARLCGCSLTMSSKIRNGARMPSGRLFTRIVRVFGLEGDEAVEAYAGGPAVFSNYIETKLFEPQPDHLTKAEPA